MDPKNAGPYGDGKNSLAKESKVGIAVTFVGSVLAAGALEWLTELDTEAWSGRFAAIGAAGVATLIGLLTAYKKSNR